MTALLRGFFSLYLSLFFLFCLMVLLFKDTYAEGISPEETRMYQPVILAGLLLYTFFSLLIIGLWHFRALKNKNRDYLLGCVYALGAWFVCIYTLVGVYLSYWD